MVFINNTADALVNGTILLAHLVPDCLCSTLLEVFRKKFCCEFVPDEVAKTVRIEFFKDMIAARNPTDLTACLAGQPEINYETARQLKLSSKSSLSNGSTLDSTTELERKYPTAYYDMASGRYVRMGYGREGVIRVVSDGNLPFYAGEEGLDDYEVEVPDSQFCFDSLMFFVQGTINGREYGNSVTAPYIGEGRMLNSTIRVADESTKSEESEETTSDPYLTETSHDQNPMLAFALNDSTGLPVGQTTMPRVATPFCTMALSVSMKILARLRHLAAQCPAQGNSSATDDEHNEASPPRLPESGTGRFGIPHRRAKVHSRRQQYANGYNVAHYAAPGARNHGHGRERTDENACLQVEGKLYAIRNDGRRMDSSRLRGGRVGGHDHRLSCTAHRETVCRRRTVPQADGLLQLYVLSAPGRR